MLSNIELAELLAREAEQHEGNKYKAARRASRKALAWPKEVTDLDPEEEKLTDLPGVGPWVARLLQNWLDDPPEVGEPETDLRRDFQTLSIAKKRVDADPGWRDELQADLQMHTVYSDGSLSVQEMAMHCIELDYTFIAITDHSKGLRIAGGMDEARLGNQMAEIDEANVMFETSEVDFRILKALEMNLSPTGEGDMEPDALESLDLVLGSFHSQLRKKEDQTDRYVAGLRNRHVHVLGHPRGRQWNFRLGLIADWPVVFAEAANLGKAVEIDAHPNRQDLNVELLELVREAGCYISIGTDAHYQPELLNIEIGLSAALTAGIPKEKILNLMTVEEVLEWTRGLRV
jgi:histidinol phosphatase-like PHP family hydrolase